MLKRGYRVEERTEGNRGNREQYRGQTAGSTWNSNISANLNLYSKRLKDMNQLWGDVFLEKKQRQNFSCPCPFNPRSATATYTSPIKITFVERIKSLVKIIAAI